jgi:MFS family permease
MEIGNTKRIAFWSGLLLLCALFFILGVAERVHIISKFFMTICLALLSAHFRPKRPYTIRTILMAAIFSNFIAATLALSTFYYVLFFLLYIIEYFIFCEIFKRKIIDWGDIDVKPRNLSAKKYSMKR